VLRGGAHNEVLPIAGASHREDDPSRNTALTYIGPNARPPWQPSRIQAKRRDVGFFGEAL